VAANPPKNKELRWPLAIGPQKKMLTFYVQSRNVYENKGNYDKMAERKSDIYVGATRILQETAASGAQFAPSRLTYGAFERSSRRITRSHMRSIYAILFVALSSSVCAAQNAGMALSRDRLTPDEIAVYQAVIMDYLRDSKGSLNVANVTVPLVIPDSLIAGGCVPSFGLEEANKRARLIHRMAPEVALNLKVTLVDRDEQRRKYMRFEGSEQAWDNGLFTLSEIVFEKDHRKAVVSRSFVCGGLCGQGQTLVLEKVAGKWKVSKRCGGWIS
jgi:hypothetical protein